MLKTFRQWAGRNWIKALGCLLLVGITFSLGYWQGHRPLSALGGVAQQQSAKDFNTDRPSLVAPSMTPPVIPADASPEMKEFIQNRATLAEKMAQLRSQSTNGAPGPKVMAQFQKENADLLKRQSELSQILVQQQ